MQFLQQWEILSNSIIFGENRNIICNDICTNFLNYILVAVIFLVESRELSISHETKI